MFSDDVFRTQLSDTIARLEAWAKDLADCATVESAVTPAFWTLSVVPQAAGACPFQLVLRADQLFNAQIGDEVYEDKPVSSFEFFSMLGRAITAGHVERITICNALTGAAEAIETRVTLEDGWAWIGERRLAGWAARKDDVSQVYRAHRFLPYRRG